MARMDPPRIAILGAGPIGLEAALYAAALQLPFAVYEAGHVGEHLQRWGHVRLFSPFGMNSTLLGRAAVGECPPDNELLTGRDFVASYLEPLAASPQLRERLQTQTRVVAVGRRGFLKHEAPGDVRRGQQPFRLLLRTADGRERLEEADAVLDCTGTYGQHRHMGDAGIPAAGETALATRIAYGLEDVLGEQKGLYADKTTIVVGGGYSAATTVCNLAALAEKHPSTWVVWLARKAGTQPIRRIANDPLRERDRLAARANMLATRADGCVEFHAPVAIDAVASEGRDAGWTVQGRRDGKAMTWQADRLIANVGYTPDNGPYRELQVHECYASLGPMALAAALLKNSSADCLAAPPQGPATLRNPEPRFFILGAKSYGRNSTFLLRAGHAQVRDAFALIAERSNLDLYATK